MKVIVVSKRTWIGILICLLLLGVGLVVYFSMQETEQEPGQALNRVLLSRKEQSGPKEQER